MCVFPIQMLFLKKFITIELLFRKFFIKLHIEVIFCETGKSITCFDKQSYKDCFLLFWKNKVLSDRRVFVKWENTHLRQISADHHTKEDGSMEELYFLQDKLYGKVQKK